MLPGLAGQLPDRLPDNRPSRLARIERPVGLIPRLPGFGHREVVAVVVLVEMKPTPARQLVQAAVEKRHKPRKLVRVVKPVHEAVLLGCPQNHLAERVALAPEVLKGKHSVLAQDERRHLPFRSGPRRAWTSGSVLKRDRAEWIYMGMRATGSRVLYK